MALQTQSNRNATAAQSRLTLDQAVAELRGGNIAEARRILRNRLVQAPNDANVLTKLADLAMDERRFEEVTILLRQAVVADPSPPRRLALLRHLQNFVGPGAALNELESFPPAARNLFDARTIEAAALGTLGMHDRQLEVYEELTKLQPKNEMLWMTIGNALKTIGKLDDAVTALRRAIEARPSFGEAYWTLANFKSFKFTDQDIAAMRKALRGKLNDYDALHFHFALGKAFEDRNEFPRSFRHYSEGNRLRAKEFTPAQTRATNFVERARATFTADFFEQRADAGSSSRDPIFVLGLHRSGSTLIEQILASHPMIEGTTEITTMQQLWDRIGRSGAAVGRGTFQQLARLSADELTAIGEEYLERTRPYRATERPMFVDKLPANWMNIGLIRLALPNAKIIDARRNPMACGFSNFKQNYASGVAFSYSLETIGFFYRDYVRLMAQIDRVQPGAVHRVINEHLIDDPEGEVRRLLDFIGVPFDPACLEFHRNTRAVRTPSAEQVRRPINRDGVDYWRHYEPWLGPLKEALGPALEGWDQPPA